MLENTLRIFLALSFAHEYTITPKDPLVYDFSYKWTIMKISNPEINYGTVSGLINTSYTPEEIYLSLNNAETNVNAGVDISLLSYQTHKVIPINIVGQANFTREGEQEFVLGDACNLSVVANYDGHWPISLCKRVLPFVNGNGGPSHNVVYPLLTTNATPLYNSRIIVAAINAAKGLSNLIRVNVEIATPASTALRIIVQPKTVLNPHMNVSFSEINTTIKNAMHQLSSLTQLPKSARDLINNIAGNMTALLANITISSTPLEGWIDFDILIPSSARIAIDVGINDYRCDETGFECSFPSVNGLRILNLSIEGLADFNKISSKINEELDAINKKIDTSLSGICDNVIGRCTISLNMRDPKKSPPFFVMILMPSLSVLVSILLTAANVWRHQQNPVLRNDGRRVSTARIVVEDFLFTLFVMSTATLFVASNTSTSTTVVIGGELPIHGFDLIHTVENLWSAGLIALSILVMLFCGIYPYVKLCVILVYTVVFHRADSRVLKVIDIVGKLSFLDTYVMIIMVSGLCVEGIADVQVLPGFYLFLAGTVFSILAGNYAVHCWRQGTTLRCSQNSESILSYDDCYNPVKVASCNNTATFSIDNLSDDFSNTTKERRNSTNAEDVYSVRQFFRSVWWAVGIPSCIATLALTLPSLIFTTLSFEVGGLAQIVIPKIRVFSLLNILSNAGFVCTVTAVITLFVAPMLNALFFQSFMFLSSWAAADALLIGCVGGLIQINQFVQFTLGGDYNYFYNVHAKMHWPLAILFAASLLSWVLYFVYLFDVRDRLTRKLEVSTKKKSTTSQAYEQSIGTCANNMYEPKTEVFGANNYPGQNILYGMQQPYIHYF